MEGSIRYPYCMGWYSKDGHAYLNSDDGLLYADGAIGYFSYWQVVEILRGTYR